MRRSPGLLSNRLGILLLVSFLFSVPPAWAVKPDKIPNMFVPASTPAHDIYYLALFALTITGVIFVVVESLLIYAVVKYRARKNDPDHEPAQVYGSAQIELAWTVIPFLIVIVLLCRGCLLVC